MLGLSGGDFYTTALYAGPGYTGSKANIIAGRLHKKCGYLSVSVFPSKHVV